MNGMRNKTITKPLLAIIGVNFIWGFDFIAIEYMMNYMSPAMFTLTRLFVGSVILTICCFIFRKGVHINREDRLRVFISGAIGMGIYFTVANLGTGLTGAAFSSLIMATVPIFGMFGDRLFFGNRITPLKTICILISIFGVYLLVSGETMGISPVGTVAMFAAAIIWTFYIVYVKPLYSKMDLLTLLTGLFISGFIVEIPIAGISQAISHAAIEITPAGILISVGTAIICTVVGQFGYIYSIGRLSTTLVSAFENVLPLTTVIFSLIIFGTMLSGSQIAGGILIMGSVTGIAFIEKNRR